MAEKSKPRFGLWALLIKLGSKILPLAGKLLKGVKTAKVSLGAASFGAYSLFLSWQFALLIMISIFIHESGHVWAMRKIGMKTKGFYFIPLLGGAAVPDEAFPSRGAEAWVAIWGPIWGGLMILPCYFIYMLTGSVLWLGIIGWIAMLNVFNLFPIMPLDGGRMIRSISFSVSSGFGFILVSLGFLLGGLLFWKLGLFLLLLIIFVGVLETGIEFRNIKAFNRIKELIKKLEITEVEKSTVLETMMEYGRINQEWRVPISSKLGDMHWHLTDQELEDLIKAREYYRLAKGKMNKTELFVAASSYIIVASLLLYVMFAVSHVPGAKEALDFFR